MTKNNDIIAWYHSLDELQRKDLEKKLNRHPACNKLITYIKTHTEDAKLNITRAARFVYEDDFDDTDTARVKRRLYNLINRITGIKELQDRSRSASSLQVCEEEREYLYYKSLVLQDHNDELYKGLQALLDKCLKKNIFELLPDILYYFSYSYKAHKRNQLYQINEDEKIVKLYADFILQRGLFIRARHLRKAGGLSYAQISDYLQKMKLIADRNKAYPRLKMIYHFSCLSLGSGPGGNKVTAMKRHYQALEKLHLNFPAFPILGYRVHYSIHINYNLLKFKAHIAYRLLDFSTAYDSARKAWDLQNEYKGVFKPTSVSDFQELIISSRFSGHYKEAIEHTAAFLENQLKKGNEMGILIASSEVVANYLYNFPKISCNKEEFISLNKQLGKLYTYYKERNKLRSAGYYINMKALFYFINGRFSEAKKYYQTKESQLYNEFYDLKTVGDLFFTLSENNIHSIPTLQQQIKQIYYKKNLKPETVTYYKLLERLTANITGLL